MLSCLVSGLTSFHHQVQAITSQCHRSFLWSICFITSESATSSLALLFGDMSTSTISRVGLTRLFDRLAIYQRTDRTKHAHSVAQFVDTVFAYSEALDRAGIRTCPEQHCDLADSIPISTLVRFLRKSQKLHLWPFLMVQDQVRRTTVVSFVSREVRSRCFCLTRSEKS